MVDNDTKSAALSLKLQMSVESLLSQKYRYRKGISFRSKDVGHIKSRKFNWIQDFLGIFLNIKFHAKQTG